MPTGYQAILIPCIIPNYPLFRQLNKMKITQLYEVKLIDGSEYRGEISYKDDKMVVLKTHEKSNEYKLRLFYNGIISIKDLGWQRV